MSMNSARDVVWKWLKLEAQLALTDPYAAWAQLWETIKPGGQVHVLLVENQYHLIVELVLFVAIVYLLAQSRASPKPSAETLTEDEVDELVRDWKPEPLVPEKSAAPQLTTPVIDKITGPHVTINGASNVLHLASYNFWGLSGDPYVKVSNRNTARFIAQNHSSYVVATTQGSRIQHKAGTGILRVMHHTQAETEKALLHYGVGSCGPRGFYGTIDAHTRLEEALADFMGTAEAIVYSFDIATMPSVLPAFTTKKDVIVMDEAASWPLRNGASLSRGQVHYFKHNDMQDLERVLRRIMESGRSMPLTRRFIVCEGISQTRGTIAPLRHIHRLKTQYKFRLVVDESLSFGVCGERGRGACEAAGLGPADVEIITGSLGTGLASTGGFCVGSQSMVDHQRLSGSGYVFSASLPPVLAVSASATLQRFCELHAAAGGGAGSGVQSGALRSLSNAARALRRAVLTVPELRILDADAPARNDSDPQGGDWASPVLVVGLAPGYWLSGAVVGQSAAAAGPAGRNSTEARKGPSGFSVEQEMAVLIRVRERLLDMRKALVDMQRPTCLEEGIVEPALRLSVTAAHTVAHVEAFGHHLQEAVVSVLKEVESGSPAQSKGSVDSLKLASGTLSM